MALKRQRTKGRKEKANFMGIRKDVLFSEEYARLSPAAVKLLIDLQAQYNGFNNGDLCAAWSIMRERGWRSKASLHRALTELTKRGWIVVSRQGGRNKCSLYATTFEAVDTCKHKHDIKANRTPSNAWKVNSGAPYVGQVTPYVGQSGNS